MNQLSLVPEVHVKNDPVLDIQFQKGQRLKEKSSEVKTHVYLHLSVVCTHTPFLSYSVNCSERHKCILGRERYSTGHLAFSS